MSTLACTMYAKRPSKRMALSPKAVPAHSTRPLAVRLKAIAKTTDNKGRVLLGGRFANRPIIIEELSNTEIIIKLARVIPEREAWLYENTEALSAVRKGLAQARRGEVTGGPDVEADADLAAQLRD